MEYLAWATLAIATMGGYAWAWRGYRAATADELFADVTPGLAPAGGHQAPRIPVPGGGEYTEDVAVAFNPPQGVRAGLAGTIVDGRAESRDVTATLVDLARRGHLTISVIESAATRSGRDWQMTLGQRGQDSLEPGEAQLLAEVFASGTVVELAQLPRTGNQAYPHALQRLYGECEERGWFRLEGTGARLRAVAWTGTLALILVAAIAGQVVGFVIAGAAALAVAIGFREPPRIPRSAEGSAVRIQSLAFKKYLATAEKEQFRYEEAVGIFSKYLPYAIVFGVADHWTKVFGDLALQAQADGYDGTLDLFWLGMGMDTMFDLAMLSMLTDGFGGGDIFGLDQMDALGTGDGFGDSLGADAGSGDLSAGDGGWGDFGGGDFGGGDFGGFGD